MGKKKAGNFRGVSPMQDATGFLKLVSSTKPLFRHGATVPEMYRILNLQSEGDVWTSGAVIEELYRRIRRDIKGKTGNDEDLYALEKHLLLRRVLDGLDAQVALKLVGIMKDASREEGWPCANIDDPSWPTVLKWASSCFEAMGRPLYGYGGHDPRVRGVGQGAKELREAGYAVRVVGTRIDSATSEPRLFADFDRQASTIGGLQLASAIFTELGGKLDPVQSRYHLVRRPDSTTFRQQSPSVPYGYLVALAVKHFEARGSDQWRDGYQKLRKLTTAFAATYDVEPYVVFDGQFNDRKSIVRYLRDIAAFDYLFTFPQCNPKYAPELLDALFSAFGNGELAKALGTSLATVTAVARYLLKERPQGPMIFSAKDVALGASLTVEEATIALDGLSHTGNPNGGFSDPLAAGRTRFWEFPLLKLDGEFLLLDAALCAPAFYEAVLARMRTAHTRQLDDRIGAAFERFAYGQMARRGLEVHAGEYSSSLGDGECDAVVETSEAVIFIEFKKKALTRKARSAQTDAIVADLAGAMLDPHCQTGRHELALVSDGQLELRRDGKSHTIRLTDRKIERLAVSLPEFGAFHSREVASQVLNLLTGTVIAGSTLSPDVAKKINSACKQLGDNYAMAIKLQLPEPARFFNCWFLGVDALLTLLENVHDGSTFWKELKRTRHVTTGSLNWHFDYSWVRGMDQNLADAADRTGATVFMGA